MKKISLLFITALLIAGCGNSGSTTSSTDKGETSMSAKVEATNVEKKAEPVEATEVKKKANRFAVVKTSMGIMKIELFENRAPITTANFISLINKGFYNGLIFHRVIKDFMIQGGCPEGTGRGGPGYKIDDEFDPTLTHSGPGILSMANAGPNTGGSQFFITLKATPWLNGRHAVFGRIVEGMDVLMAIGNVKTLPGDRPAKKVVIKKITIVQQ